MIAWLQTQQTRAEIVAVGTDSNCRNNKSSRKEEQTDDTNESLKIEYITILANCSWTAGGNCT